MPRKVLNDCVEKLRHPNVTVSAKGKSFTILNSNKDWFARGKIDGCLITIGPRADNFITKIGHGTAVVELKGRDVEHAVEQLFATVVHANCVGWIERPTKLLIICAKYPSFDTYVAKAKLKAKRMGMSLRVVCKSLICEFEQI